jgi:hypothetical protein
LGLLLILFSVYFFREVWTLVPNPFGRNWSHLKTTRKRREGNDRFGSLADITARSPHVRFTP